MLIVAQKKHVIASTFLNYINANFVGKFTRVKFVESFLQFLILSNLNIVDEWTFSEHIKIHAGQAKYFCDICGKQCNTTLALMKHNEIHLIEKDLKAGEKVKPDSKLNICTVINKFKYKSEIDSVYCFVCIIDVQ